MRDSSISILQAVFQLLRVLPPQELEKILYGTSILLPENSEEILQRVDRPLQVLLDETTYQHFICSDYNKDGDAYRSPWSNRYFPDTQLQTESTTFSLSAIGGDEMPTGLTPSGPLRDMEIRFNTALDQYRAAYLNGGVSSAFVWSRQVGEEGFGAAFLLAKDMSDSSLECSWNSIHVVEVSTANTVIQYRLLSTVILKLAVMSSDIGSLDLGANLTQKRDTQKRLVPGLRIEDVPGSHLEVIGPLIESVELELRKQIEDVLIIKTESILSSLRILGPIEKTLPNTSTSQKDDRMELNVVKELTKRIDSNGPLEFNSFETK